MAAVRSRHVSPTTVQARRAPYRRRRIVAGTIVAGAAAAAVVLAGLNLERSHASRPRSIATKIDDADGRSRVLVLPSLALRRPASIAAALRQHLPPSVTLTRGPARVTYALDAPATARRAIRSRNEGVALRAVRYPISVAIAAPVITQRLRNDCEATALSILLATTGVTVDQLELQRELPLSGPLDPRETAAGRVWGDPEAGFVGRVGGGGSAGGFGVYPGPISRVASRHGLKVRDLTGSSVDAIYARLLTGHPVMAWVALSNGPYASWLSPQGKRIRVNFGEHTVVLTGLHGAQLSVDDPLTGSMQTWSRADFKSRWQALGRRALSS